MPSASVWAAAGRSESWLSIISTALARAVKSGTSASVRLSR
jgi:hypothetical protein